jgi:hypothetical protein
MGTSFLRGQQLGRSDLNIFLTNSSGHPVNAAEINYAIYDNTTGKEVLVGPQRRIPVNSSVGEYFVSLVVPLDANIGDYRVRWAMREMVGGPLQSVVQEFNIQDREVATPSFFSVAQIHLLKNIRIMLRDLNPDRNYKFRPPAHEETIDQFSKVFGYIWEDEELVQFLEFALDMIIAAPPRTPFNSLDHLMMQRPEWRTLLLVGAQIWAVNALQANWIADEFSVAPETEVTVLLPSGEEISLSIENLYNICYENFGFILTPEVRSQIREVFRAGLLRVRSVTPQGEVVEAKVSDVLRHNSRHKGCVRITLKNGASVTTTVDHSLFRVLDGLLHTCQSGAIRLGDPLAVVLEGRFGSDSVVEVQEVTSRWITYDLSVPGPENFVLSNGILAHNSYSIGGVSLDLEKSSKYESLKQGASDQFDKQLDRAKATVKYIKGLQMPKYGTGARSSFGPFTGRGVLTPAKFMGA